MDTFWTLHLLVVLALVHTLQAVTDNENGSMTHDHGGGMAAMETSMPMHDMENTTMSPNGSEDHAGHDGHSAVDNNDTTMDHGSMDHGSMDHTSTDDPHGDHGASSGGHQLYFFFSVDAIILFEKWVTKSWQTMLGSCVGIGVIAALYEGLKLLREHLRTRKAAAFEKYSITESDSSCCDCSGACHHLLQTLLHMIQVTISYGLMLVFMTFNAWLCIAIIVGAGVGYLLFGWKFSHPTDVYDHCN